MLYTITWADRRKSTCRTPDALADLLLQFLPEDAPVKRVANGYEVAGNVRVKRERRPVTARERRAALALRGKG